MKLNNHTFQLNCILSYTSGRVALQAYDSDMFWISYGRPLWRPTAELMKKPHFILNDKGLKLWPIRWNAFSLFLLPPHISTQQQHWFQGNHSYWRMPVGKSLTLICYRLANASEMLPVQVVFEYHVVKQLSAALSHWYLSLPQSILRVGRRATVPGSRSIYGATMG